ncbi:pyridoxamine 5'-phosphate oxidase family protein [Oceanicella sp. SM1341]|uniref:pyridoxamine 5'-phosphate oxidase family protein n=1 Tax=Oceanicella sp. SM1341 TaxID=1548889 RepID=UPI000E4B3A3C|nr:pyridoxamine 5'-phosphate oxidase family protein [Oceanicella sp. SM1341]
MTQETSPFHPGERAAQARAGVSDLADRAAGFVRDHMPEQHRAFFAGLPFLVVAAAGGDGRPWVTLLEGRDGFVSSPDPRSLLVDAAVPEGDPLAGALGPGSAIGVLGIELATRRRNRMNGVLRAGAAGLSLEVQQSFGNCPAHIHPRGWFREAAAQPAAARTGTGLDPDQAARIAAADTFFVGTGVARSQDGRATDGYDASHRGGAPGFVRVTADGRLRIPDYSGNNFFNTIGNLLRDPRIGLVFPDFATGGLLHVAGTARIEWVPRASHDPQARRMIEVTVEAVIDRPGALSLRWREETADLRAFVLAEKTRESAGITSFRLVPADGGALPPFLPGQHLPVELDVPGQPGPVRRSYSLSGAPDGRSYRISVKREERGIASGFLHDIAGPGTLLRARPPAGDFTLPPGTSPLMLVSAGVGVTPMLAMLQAVAEARSGRPVRFVHVARDGRSHAFRGEVEALVAATPGVERRYFYTAPRPEDTQGRTFDATGRVTAADLLALAPGPGADYMFCGPAGFIAGLRSGLEQAGVAPARLHAETFGPAG